MTYDQVNLSVHRLLFISDLWKVEPIADGQLFQWGNPLFTFCNVRVLGVVVKKEKHPGSSNVFSLTIDDAEGIITILADSSQSNSVSVGSLVECLGILKHNTDIRPSRWIESKAVVVKDDVMYEVLRPLEIIDIYKELYWRNSEKKDRAPLPIQGGTPKARLGVGSRASPHKSHFFPQSDSDNPISTPFNNPSNDGGENIPFRPLLSPSPKQVFAAPSGATQSQQSLKGKDKSSSYFSSQDMYFEDELAMAVAMNTEIENFIREKSENGVGMEELQTHFPMFRDKLHEVLNEILLSGAAYELGGRYFPL